MIVERATEDDLQYLFEIDSETFRDRHDFITAYLRERKIIIARDGAIRTGYALVDQTFFDRYFIRALSIHPDHDDMAVAAALVGYIEKTCPEDRIFTACRSSDTTAQACYENLGFARSGIIENIDDTDETELIYCKKLDR
jgi:ribosomal protein S18 acetylase RimI-like enzyme